MTTKFIPMIAGAAILAGCATAYQSEGLSGGFTETQLDTNVWRVSFRGNGYTRSEKAEDFAMLRSAELALSNGYTHFAFANSRSSSQTSTMTTPVTSHTTGSANVYGNSIYGSATTKTYGGDTYSISKPESTNTVVMFKGKPDVGGMVYSAVFVCDSLGKKYQVVCNAPKK